VRSRTILSMFSGITRAQAIQVKCRTMKYSNASRHRRASLLLLSKLLTLSLSKLSSSLSSLSSCGGGHHRYDLDCRHVACGRRCCNLCRHPAAIATVILVVVLSQLPSRVICVGVYHPQLRHSCWYGHTWLASAPRTVAATTKGYARRGGTIGDINGAWGCKLAMSPQCNLREYDVSLSGFLCKHVGRVQRAL
jgi:hypothetical protein